MTVLFWHKPKIYTKKNKIIYFINDILNKFCIFVI